MRYLYPLLVTALTFALVILSIFLISSVSAPGSHDLLRDRWGLQIYCDQQADPVSCKSESIDSRPPSERQEIRTIGEEHCQTDALRCNGFYLMRHLRNIALGIAVFVFAFLMPLSSWRVLAVPGYIGTIAVLVALLVGSSLAGEWGTARSWINIPGLPSIQPSEVAKLMMILYLALWIEKHHRNIGDFQKGFIPYVLLVLPVLAAVALQPDYGSLMVISAIAGVLLLMGGGRVLHMALSASMLGVVALGAILSYDYIRERVMVFLNQDTGAGCADAACYQIQQATLAIGSGQWLGVGLGQSGQRHGWLPEIESDFIFAAAAEEMGFLRILIVLGLYLALVFTGYTVAQRSRTRYAALVAIGITSWVGIQTFLNIGVTLSIIPLTGITLPFLSYGGSSMMTLLGAMGILTKIALEADSSNSKKARYHTSYE